MSRIARRGRPRRADHAHVSAHDRPDGEVGDGSDFTPRNVEHAVRREIMGGLRDDRRYGDEHDGIVEPAGILRRQERIELLDGRSLGFSKVRFTLRLLALPSSPRRCLRLASRSSERSVTRMSEGPCSSMTALMTCI